jgi:hypothetical protein
MQECRERTRRCPDLADFVAKVGCGRWMAASVRLRVTGFDLPTMTLVTQLQALRSTKSRIGWRSSDQRSESPKILGYGSQNKFVLGTLRSAQAKPTKPQNTLQVGEPHLDLFAFTP